jgi:hypothetical protein
MRDKTHNQQIERWAIKVKSDPNWKKDLKPFLDAQIINARESYKKILLLPNGKDKLKRIRDLK